MKITSTLAERIGRIGFGDLPETTVLQAKMAIMDNVGNALGALETEVGGIFLKSRSPSADGGCTIWGGAGRAAMMEAAFINAFLCQVLDFDDTVEIGSLAVSHPGPAIVPAAVAAAEIGKCTGKALIRAIVMGYEVAARLAKAIEPRRDDFWGFGNTQVMGAAAASAVVLDLPARALVNALGIAAASAPVPNTNMMWGLESRPMSWVKDGVGFAASTGLMSALLARNGLFGCQNALDARSGYYLLCGSSDYKDREILKGFGEDYLFDQLSFKPYPTCRFMQSSLDSLVMLLAETALTPADIETVEVYLTPYLAKVFNVTEPVSMIDAQFSLPYAAAMILKGVAPSPDWYSPENLTSPEIRRISRNIKLIADEAVERRRAEESVLSPKVRLRAKSGRVYEKQEYCAKGHPQKPFSRKDFEDKFRDNAVKSIGENRVRHVIESIDHLEACTDIAELIQLFA